MTTVALPPRADRTAYYAAARSWSDEATRQANGANRTAWTFAGLAALVAVAQTIALVLLQPLATPAVTAIEVERSAGPAQGRQPLTRGPLSASPDLIRTEIARYVARREGLDPATFALDHRAVALASSGPAREGYIADWRVGGPRHGAATVETRIVARVLGVTLTGPGAAVARFETVRCEGAAPCGPPSVGEVRLAFALSDAPMAPRDRLANPLGLIVTAYGG